MSIHTDDASPTAGRPQPTGPAQPPTLRSLLRRDELSLRLLTAEDALSDGALDRLISWVHSSDLPDPTPFLIDGNVLLTTGTQFQAAGVAEPDAAEAGTYVDRLVAHGVAGLGFGTEVARSGTPAPLVDACASRGLPLLEVPYRTPFIAVSRANADAIAAQVYSRSIWTLQAQRAISLAALRPDGLGATLAELSRQLDAWVGLYGAGGGLERAFPGMPEEGEAAELAQEVQSLLVGGRHASRNLRTAGRAYSLQTLGAAGELRGVLAIGRRGELDEESRQVAVYVVALAWLALQQNSDLVRARELLRSGLLNSLHGGDAELAGRIFAEMWGPLPQEPVRVAVVDIADTRPDTVSELLELWVSAHPGELFFATEDQTLVLCVPDGADEPMGMLVQRYGARVGMSDPAPYHEFTRAADQAMQALRHASDSPGVVAFAQLAESGVLAYLGNTDARAVAVKVLAPLRDHDRRRGTARTGGGSGAAGLTRTVRVWLECNCEYDAAAAELGVHRHTVRSRVDLAGDLLGLDLRTFAARADLWAAFAAVSDDYGGAGTISPRTSP